MEIVDHRIFAPFRDGGCLCQHFTEREEHVVEELMERRAAFAIEQRTCDAGSARAFLEFAHEVGFSRAAFGTNQQNAILRFASEHAGEKVGHVVAIRHIPNTANLGGPRNGRLRRRWMRRQVGERATHRAARGLRLVKVEHIVAAEGARDALFVGSIEEDDTVLGVDAASLIEFVVNEFGFETRAAADAEIFFALETAAIGFGDHDEDAVSEFELLFAPAGPFFVDRLRRDVLVESDFEVQARCGGDRPSRAPGWRGRRYRGYS